MKDCKTKRKCFHCQSLGKHHRSLCPEKFSGHTAGVLATMTETVLMQTAQATVSNPVSGSKSSAQIFFDSGSHRSYVVEALANKLDLKTGDEDRLSLATFGSSAPTIIVSKAAKLDIRTKGGGVLHITANIVPTITAPITRAAYDVSKLSNWRARFGDLQLADTIPKKSEAYRVDILIGNDHYLDIVQPDRKEIQPGLYLLASELGWIVSGRIPRSVNDSFQPSMMVALFGTPTAKHTQTHADLDSNASDARACLQDFWALEKNRHS